MSLPEIHKQTWHRETKNLVKDGERTICIIHSGTKEPGEIEQIGKAIELAPKMIAALSALAGIEAWINDREMKEHFQKTVYPILNQFI